MTQITYSKESIRGTFSYLATDDDSGEIVSIDWDFGDFETFMYYMEAYIKKDFSKVMDGCLNLSDVQLIGISLSAGNFEELTRIDMHDGWLRATSIFNLDKFQGINEDKFNRIMSIIKE